MMTIIIIDCIRAFCDKIIRFMYRTLAKLSISSQFWLLWIENILIYCMSHVGIGDRFESNIIITIEWVGVLDFSAMSSLYFVWSIEKISEQDLKWSYANYRQIIECMLWLGNHRFPIHFSHLFSNSKTKCNDYYSMDIHTRIHIELMSAKF